MEILEAETRDGIIGLDSTFAKEIGFVKEKFDGYLWKDGEMILISFINSKQPNQGNFSRLLEALWSKGYTIGVSSPSDKIVSILKRKGFAPYRYEDCICWIKEPILTEVAKRVKQK